VLVDIVKILPPRTALSASLGAVSDGDTGRPIRRQSSSIEVEFVTDPGRTTDEVTETMDCLI